MLYMLKPLTRTLTAALLTALAFAGAADAHFAPKNRVHNFRHVATATWGPNVCGESPMTIPIIRTKHEAIPAEHRPKTTDYAALAPRDAAGRCLTYVIDEEWSSDDLCTAVVHETGHHAGYTDETNTSDTLHSRDHKHVMYRYLNSYAPCHAWNVRRIAASFP